MNDDAQQNTATSSQDPLAFLESILEDAKKKGAGSSPPVLSGEEDVTESPEIDPSVREQLLAEQQAVEKKKQEEETARLESYRQQMQGEIKNTDAYKARESQDEDEKNEQANPADSDGFQIDQVEHKKI
ncbi:MAG TPA: hypothetical protein PKX78_02290 [Candidatus Woesebacteria bacterium]|nr:hypothetical protein [Candidatus Woesebacteria bacterium]